jgi:hypothetical protein
MTRARGRNRRRQAARSTYLGLKNATLRLSASFDEIDKSFLD